jgi:hypothetical protein
MTPSFFSHCCNNFDKSIKSHHVDSGGGGNSGDGEGGGTGGGFSAVSGWETFTSGKHSIGNWGDDWDGQSDGFGGSSWDTDLDSSCVWGSGNLLEETAA